MSKTIEDIKTGVTMGEDYQGVNGMELFNLDMDEQVARFDNLEERIGNLLVQIDHLNEKYDELMEEYKREVEQNDRQ